MMTLIPALNQYTNHIVSSTNHQPAYSNYKQYANIFVMPEYYQPGLIYLSIGGVNQTLELQRWVPIKINNAIEAYVTQVNLNITKSANIFQITHCNESALMSAILYGFLATNGNEQGYGHPASLNYMQSKYICTYIAMA